MTAEEACEILDIPIPYTRKINCPLPEHADSTPSLHVYPGDGGFYCFGCGQGGDGWKLLSLITGKPVGELMREAGVELGPRARPRWQQLEELQAEAREATYEFHATCKRLHGLEKVAEYADRVDILFGGLAHKRVFDEDVMPVDVARQVRDLKAFYARALEDLEVIASMSESSEGHATMTQLGD